MNRRRHASVSAEMAKSGAAAHRRHVAPLGEPRCIRRSCKQSGKCRARVRQSGKNKELTDRDAATGGCTRHITAVSVIQ